MSVDDGFTDRVVEVGTTFLEAVDGKTPSPSPGSTGNGESN